MNGFPRLQIHLLCFQVYSQIYIVYSLFLHSINQQQHILSHYGELVDLCEVWLVSSITARPLCGLMTVH